MSAKRMTQREIGFIQGIAWAAGFVSTQGGHIATDDIINESGIAIADFRIAYECDLEQVRATNPELELPRGK